MQQNKDADRLRGYREAGLRLCFHISNSQFSCDGAHIIIKRLMTRNMRVIAYSPYMPDMIYM